MKSIKTWSRTLLVIASLAGSESSLAARVTVGLNAGETTTMVSNGPVSIQANCVLVSEGYRLDLLAVTTAEDSYAPQLGYEGGAEGEGGYLQPDETYDGRFLIGSESGTYDPKIVAYDGGGFTTIVGPSGHVVLLESIVLALNQSYSAFDCIVSAEVEKYSIAKPKKPKLLQN